MTDYESDLKELVQSLEGEILAHDEKSELKRHENRRFTLAIQVCSAVIMLVSGGSAYLGGDASTIFAWLGVIFSSINYILTSWYDKWSPGEERSQHIIAISKKSEILSKIKRQLLAPEDKKEDYFTFYQWIHSQHADVESSTPFLPQKFLEKVKEE